MCLSASSQNTALLAILMIGDCIEQHPRRCQQLLRVLWTSPFGQKSEKILRPCQTHVIYPSGFILEMFACAAWHRTIPEHIKGRILISNELALLNMSVYQLAVSLSTVSLTILRLLRQHVVLWQAVSLFSLYIYFCKAVIHIRALNCTCLCLLVGQLCLIYLDAENVSFIL